MQHHPLILHIDKSGTPKRWIHYEKAAYHYIRDNILWENGKQSITLHGGYCTDTGKQSTLTINSIIAIKGRVSVRKRPPMITNKILFRRDGMLCGYCGDKFLFQQLTRDHIFPKIRGGLNTWDNIVSACKRCNSHKGHKLLDQWAQPLIFEPYIPTHAEVLFLSNPNMLDDQYEFLLNLIPQHSRIHLNYLRKFNKES